MTEPKNYDAMSSEEIDNEILLIQKELNTQIENLGIVQVEMTNLKRKELEAKEVIRRTKQDIRRTLGSGIGGRVPVVGDREDDLCGI